MFERGFTAYEYDGTIEGLLCCVFESYQKKEMPLDITPSGERQLTLGTTRFIQTDLTKAARVRRAIPRKISHDALMLFESYHASIYELEIKKRLYSSGAMEADTYRERIPRLDKTRTYTHNALLTQVNVLNRIAAEGNLPPVYDGIVSEERPYRREVANAVLDFVQQIILNRA